MLTLNLWRAEWLKTRKRPANIGILLFTLVILAVAIAVVTGIALYNGKGSEEYISALAFLPYPNGLTFAVQVLGGIGSFLAVIFVANSIGSEYSRDTWKMILPRRGSRMAFIVTKLLIALFCMILLIAIVMLMGQIFAWIGVVVLGGNFTISLGTTFSDQLKSVIFILMQMVFYGVLTLLAAVLTRSTIGGIVVGIVAPVVFQLAQLISTGVARVLPTTHLSNLQAQWLINDDGFREGMDAQFGGHITATTSILVLLGYIAVFMAVSLYLFRKRDMAGG